MSEQFTNAEIPIWFSASMTTAIREGRKTVKRSVIKPQPVKWRQGLIEWHNGGSIYHMPPNGLLAYCPYRPDSLCWVGEPFRFGQAPNDEQGQGVALYNDGSVTFHPELDPKRYYWCRMWKKYSSILMPRWASRITLRIVDVTVEQLQDITEDDARAEGIPRALDNLGSRHSNPTPIYSAFPEKPGGFLTARSAFEALWDSTNRGHSWDTNPWVWRIAFEVVNAPDFAKHEETYEPAF